MRLGLLLAALVLLVGPACTGGSTQEGSPQGDPSPSFARTECPRDVVLAVVGDLVCGSLSVPENREPDRGSVEVFVARLTPPVETGREPVVVVGTDIAAHLNYAGISPLAQSTGREVVFMDQRGTGHSTPSLACPPPADPVTWADPTGSDSWRQRIARATAECYRSLTDEGIDVAAYDVAAMAADVADLARVLDLGRVDLITYGSASRVSLEVMRSDPDVLRAVVMDSPDLPGVDARALVAPSLREALARVLRWCAQDPQCRREHPAPRSLFERALEAVDRRPLTVRVPLPGQSADVVLDGALLARLARRTLTDGGSAGSWALPIALPGLLDLVAERRRHRLSEPLSELIGAQGPLCAGYQSKCTPAHVIDAGVANTVLCRDVAPFSGGRPVAARDPALRAAYDRSWWWDTCESWPVPPADPILAEPVTSDVPTLILVGGAGASTPPAVVRANTQGLSSSSILIDPLHAHNVIGSGCLLELRNAWLDDPEPVRQPPGCLDPRLEW